MALLLCLCYFHTNVYYDGKAKRCQRNLALLSDGQAVLLLFCVSSELSTRVTKADQKVQLSESMVMSTWSRRAHSGPMLPPAMLCNLC